MIYLTTTKDLIKNQKLLTTLAQEDNLFILYKDTNASIPIEAYPLLSSLKCNIQFKQYTEQIQDQFSLVYELGILSGQNKNAGIRALTDEHLQFMSIFQKEKLTRKKTGTVNKVKTAVTASKADPSVKEQSFMNEPEEPAENTKTMEEPVKKKRGRKSKQDDQKDTSKDDFDKSYDQLTALFNSVKTKTFDPNSSMYGIVKAVKASIEEKTRLEESFKVWFPNNSGKIIKAFAGKEEELIDIVKNLNDEE